MFTRCNTKIQQSNDALPCEQDGKSSVGNRKMSVLVGGRAETLAEFYGPTTAGTVAHGQL